MILSGPSSHSFVSQRLRLHYADWGNPEAPPLLLVHGSRDHCRSWDWVAQELARDWHVIAPDLRGHGDSAWSPDGDYGMAAFIYDLAQLVHQLKIAPFTMIAHSLGGNIALRYTGLFPDAVRKLVAIEGMGPSPQMMAERDKVPLAARFHRWIEEKRAASGRTPRRYPSLEEAYNRMKAENGYLSDEQARHLTTHGTSQNEDGSYSWKFDNYFRVWAPVDLPYAEVTQLWEAITCPTLLLYGANSHASNPEKDGRAKHFRNGRVIEYENAGHWLHHDQFDRFMSDVKTFIA